MLFSLYHNKGKVDGASIQGYGGAFDALSQVVAGGHIQAVERL